MWVAYGPIMKATYTFPLPHPHSPTPSLLLLAALEQDTEYSIPEQAAHIQGRYPLACTTWVLYPPLASWTSLAPSGPWAPRIICTNCSQVIMRLSGQEEGSFVDPPPVGRRGSLCLLDPGICSPDISHFVTR